MINKNGSYKTLFKGDLGKKVYDDLRARFYDKASYTKGDPYHTAYVEGQREVIRYITALLEQNGDSK